MNVYNKLKKNTSIDFQYISYKSRMFFRIYLILPLFKNIFTYIHHSIIQTWKYQGKFYSRYLQGQRNPQIVKKQLKSWWVMWNLPMG